MGVEVIAVERSMEVYPLPRAAHFDHEAMRLFQHLQVLDGSAGSVRPAPPYEFRAADGSVLLRFDPDVAGSPSGWAAGYMIHQPGIERALRTKLAGHELVEIRLGVALETLAQDAGGITAGLSGLGAPSTIRARYLVGCNGASSRVRETLGIELEDYGFDESWLVVDALVPDSEAVPKVNLQICDPARPTTCVLMSAGRHRWEFMMLPGETPEQALNDGFIQALLAPWLGSGVTLDRKAVYRFHALVARSWREGRVLLAGDAAHQMPPSPARRVRGRRRRPTASDAGRGSGGLRDRRAIGRPGPCPARHGGLRVRPGAVQAAARGPRRREPAARDPGQDRQGRAAQAPGIGGRAMLTTKTDNAAHVLMRRQG